MPGSILRVTVISKLCVYNNSNMCMTQDLLVHKKGLEAT